MRYLSIDCGIRHLGMCRLDASQKRIEHWEVISLIPPSVAVRSVTLVDIAERIADAFLERPWTMTDVDRVVIERQPSRNPKMIAVQSALTTFLVAAHRCGTLAAAPAISFASAKARWKRCPAEHRGKKGYANRKNTAVLAARTWLHRHGEAETLGRFEASRKKDDLADCLLQGLMAAPSCRDEITGLFRAEMEPRAAAGRLDALPRPRAPTAKQLASGKWSAANVAHYFQVRANRSEAAFRALADATPELSAALERWRRKIEKSGPQVV